jgi:hypothetical protein
MISCNQLKVFSIKKSHVSTFKYQNLGGEDISIKTYQKRVCPQTLLKNFIVVVYFSKQMLVLISKVVKLRLSLQKKSHIATQGLSSSCFSGAETSAECSMRSWSFSILILIKYNII